MAAEEPAQHAEDLDRLLAEMLESNEWRAALEEMVLDSDALLAEAGPDLDDLLEQLGNG